jgi:hypothetical protein
MDTPLSVLVGLLGETRGMAAAGWALTAVTAMAGVLLVLTAVSARRAGTEAEADRACRETPVPVT